MHLPEEEPDDACATNENGDAAHEIDAVGAKDAESIEQAAKAERGEHDGKRIERRIAFGLGATLLDEKGSCHNDDGDKCRNDVEHDMPIDRIDHDARNRGTDCRGEGDDEAEDAHGRAPAVDGKHDEQNGHGHGHEYARTYSLNEAPGQENVEGGPPSAKQGADGKDAHGEEEEAAYREAVLKVGGNGNHDGVHECETRGKPLTRRRIDGHLGHDGGKRRRNKRLVENGNERADYDDDKHHPLFSG